MIVPCSVPVCAALPHCLLLQPRASHRLTPPYTALHRLTPHAASSPTVVVLRRAFAPLRARTTRRPCRPRRAVPPTLPNTVSSPVYSPVYSPVPARPLLHVRLKLPQQLFQKRREATRRDPTRPYFAPRIALPPALRVPRIAPPPSVASCLKASTIDLVNAEERRGHPSAPRTPLSASAKLTPLLEGSLNPSPLQFVSNDAYSCLESGDDDPPVVPIFLTNERSTLKGRQKEQEGQTEQEGQKEQKEQE